jgi:hypothetical protein
MARTVTNCFNRCKSDYECSFDKKCCPNACGSTSCAESSSISYGSDLRDYSKSSHRPEVFNSRHDEQGANFVEARRKILKERFFVNGCDDAL